MLFRGFVKFTTIYIHEPACNLYQLAHMAYTTEPAAAINIEVISKACPKKAVASPCLPAVCVGS